MFCGADNGLSYVTGLRYRIRSTHARGNSIDDDYWFEYAAPGFGVIHYVFRSCAGGWLESFSDLLIFLGEIDIRPYRKGKQKCSVLNAQIS